MPLEPIQYLLAALSGGLVAFSLGLVGGGGSILAVPLMLYLVGVTNPHIAIGTSALSVAASAAAALVSHARAGNVKWPCAMMFAAAGVIGAYGGSTVGKAFDGQKLLFLFALVMIVVGISMLRARRDAGNPDVVCDKANAPKVLGYGIGGGAFSGFFGIGGGFLIVPGLIASTGMPMLNAIGSSLVAVSAFGLTTALNYAASGLIDWTLAGLFIGGGIAGSFAGAAAAKRLSANAGLLKTVFAVLIFIVALYMLWQSARAF
jgi:uncharacterized membrane protein YfcA